MPGDAEPQSDEGQPPNNPDEYMSLREVEPLDEDETVGIIHEWERGPTTVEFADAGGKVSHRVRDEIGDEDSRLFVACDDGEMRVGYDPMFDAPIVTNLTVKQADLALTTLKQEAGHTEPIDVLFDDAGPIIFRADGMVVGATPGIFPWQHGTQPRRTRSPTGPTVRGGPDE